VGVYRDCPHFLSTVPPIISRTGKATNFKLGRYIHQGPSEQKPFKILRENGAWAYPGTAPIFWVPPIILRKGKATNFKFGRYIHRVHARKSPVRLWEKMERGRIQGLPKFFEYPLLSQEWVKLRTSNFVCTFLVSIRTKVHYKFLVIIIITISGWW